MFVFGHLPDLSSSSLSLPFFDLMSLRPTRCSHPPSSQCSENINSSGGCSRPIHSHSKKRTVVSNLITETLFLGGGGLISDCRYRIELPEELVATTETDLWEFQQKVSHHRYRFSLEFHYIPLQIHILGSKRINSVIISATTVFLHYFPLNKKKKSTSNVWTCEHFRVIPSPDFPQTLFLDCQKPNKNVSFNWCKCVRDNLFGDQQFKQFVNSWRNEGISGKN